MNCILKSLDGLTREENIPYVAIGHRWHRVIMSESLPLFSDPNKIDVVKILERVYEHQGDYENEKPVFQEISEQHMTRAWREYK